MIMQYIPITIYISVIIVCFVIDWFEDRKEKQYRKDK